MRTLDLDFFVAGMPGTKGSARAFVVKGRAVITNDAGAKAKSWASCVSAAAHAAMAGAGPFDGPVEVAITFHLQRPKGHYLPATKKRPAPELRADAPRFVGTKPDGDKLERCTWDALTGIVVTDDARIARWSGGKLYTDSTVGAAIRVRALGGAP